MSTPTTPVEPETTAEDKAHAAAVRKAEREAVEAAAANEAAEAARTTAEAAKAQEDTHAALERLGECTPHQLRHLADVAVQSAEVAYYNSLPSQKDAAKAALDQARAARATTRRA